MSEYFERATWFVWFMAAAFGLFFKRHWREFAVLFVIVSVAIALLFLPGCSEPEQFAMPANAHETMEQAIAEMNASADPQTVELAEVKAQEAGLQAMVAAVTQENAKLKTEVAAEARSASFYFDVSVFEAVLIFLSLLSWYLYHRASAATQAKIRADLSQAESDLKSAVGWVEVETGKAVGYVEENTVELFHKPTPPAPPPAPPPVIPATAPTVKES